MVTDNGELRQWTRDEKKTRDRSGNSEFLIRYLPFIIYSMPPTTGPVLYIMDPTNPVLFTSFTLFFPPFLNDGVLGHITFLFLAFLDALFYFYTTTMTYIGVFTLHSFIHKMKRDSMAAIHFIE